MLVGATQYEDDFSPPEKAPPAMALVGGRSSCAGGTTGGWTWWGRCRAHTVRWGNPVAERGYVDHEFYGPNFFD